MRPARFVTLVATAVALAAPAAAGAQEPVPVAAAACENTGMRPDGANHRAVRAAVICLLNEERTSRGMRRLRANAKLRRAADRHSRAMKARDFFDHTSPSGTTMLGRIKAAGYLRGADAFRVGENIAWGTQNLATPAEIVESWMESPGHRDNILNRRFRDIGVGLASGGQGAYYTTNFGTRA